MLSFIARRLAGGAVLIAAISAIAFFLLYLGSGNIGRNILGRTASKEDVAALNSQLGLDQPVIGRYFDWLGSAVTGDLGSSWFSGQQVTDVLSIRLTVTLTLVVGSTLLTAILAVSLGVLAASRRGWIDSLVQTMSVVGFAIPGFLTALALVLLFAIQLGWFPPTGYTRFETDPAAWLSSVTLPVIALSIGSISAIAPQVRGSVIDALRADYVRTLRSRGLSSRRIVYKHVLRNAGGPALAVLAVQFVGLIGGTVIVEQVFNIPGIGPSAVDATIRGDIPIVMGIVIVTAIIVVILNLVVDLLQGFLNPKVRVS